MYAVANASAKKAAASDSVKSLDRLKSFFIFFRFAPDCETFQTIAFRSKKDRDKTDAGSTKCCKLYIARAGSENQDNSDSQDDDGSTQVVRANKAYDWKQCEHSAAHKPEPVCSFMGSFNLPGQKKHNGNFGKLRRLERKWTEIQPAL